MRFHLVATGGMEGGWWAVGDMVIVVVCMAAQWRKQGMGVWASDPKPSRRGSVSGVPLQMAVVGDAGRSWSGAYNVAMVVGVACSRNAGPKNRNRAARAQFRAYRWKMRWGGDGVRLWGGAYDVATGLRQWVGAIG
jgi:hypothetical protein